MKGKLVSTERTRWLEIPSLSVNPYQDVRASIKFTIFLQVRFCDLAAAMIQSKQSLTEARRSKGARNRTGEEVGAPVIVLEHGEHILDAAARRRTRLLVLPGGIPARRLLAWGEGSEELGDGADGRPDHRRRVRRRSSNARHAAPVATPLRRLQRHRLEDAAGARQVAARRPGQRRQPGKWAWRHRPPTATCSRKPTDRRELALSRGRQKPQQVVRRSERHAPAAHCHSLVTTALLSKRWPATAAGNAAGWFRLPA